VGSIAAIVLAILGGLVLSYPIAALIWELMIGDFE
jgi:hypothetical protein